MPDKMYRLQNVTVCVTPGPDDQIHTNFIRALLGRDHRLIIFDARPSLQKHFLPVERRVDLVSKVSVVEQLL